MKLLEWIASLSPDSCWWNAPKSSAEAPVASLAENYADALIRAERLNDIALKLYHSTKELLRIAEPCIEAELLRTQWGNGAEIADAQRDAIHNAYVVLMRAERELALAQESAELESIK